MIVSRLVLGNWRNFRNVDARMGERVFVLGANASGKSNFLDALRFLRDVAEGGLQSAVARRGGLSNLRSLAARSEHDVEIAVEIGEAGQRPRWRYSIGITRPAGGRRPPALRHERVWNESKLVLERPGADDKRDPLRMTQTHLEQPIDNAEFREVGRFLASIRASQAVPELLETIAATPEKPRRARLRQIERALRRVIPQLKHLTDARDETGAPHLEAEFEHWRPGAERHREDLLSDGTLRLAGLLWALFDGEGPLVWDTPEAYLAGAAVRELPALMRAAQRKRQVIVSTHSAELLSDKGIGGDEMLLLSPGPEGTRVEAASDLLIWANSI